MLLMIGVAGCQKDFLDRAPQTQLTTEAAFDTYDNFRTYTWSLYDYLSGYGVGSQFYQPGLLSSEANSDNISYTQSGGQSAYAFQTKLVPSTGGATLSQVISGWNFSYVRKVNVMLDNIDQSSMSQTDKDHWRSVGYFFRALRYYDLIAAFGDVPWIEHALTDTSTAELFGERTPRDQVAKQVLDNLIFAESHIKAAGDGPNTVNVNVVRAFISRFALLEGTWRKYHNLGGAEIYLEACKTYSEKLLPVFPSIMPNFDDVYNTEDLSGKPGIILFKQYATNLTTHQAGPRLLGSTSTNVDVTKDAVESFLCTDGKPVSTSTLYAGDNSMSAEFRNRDNRLYFTVVPPYKVVVGNPNTTWSFTGNPADAEYINLMKTLSPANKQLPMVQWSQSMTTGTVLSMSPHFRNFNAGQPQGVGELGYLYWRTYNRLPLDATTFSTNDCPLFRIEEVWLNYAEAMFELGLFTQSVADQTINKLRPRANVSNMNIAAVDASFDRNRDTDVNPLLWEIRRERRVELMGDGFRFNDLKRWKKGTYLNKQHLGVWVNNAEFGNKLNVKGGGASGYVQFFGIPTGWLDKYYYEPVPTQELALNPTLKQSPGW